MTLTTKNLVKLFRGTLPVSSHVLFSLVLVSSLLVSRLPWHNVHVYLLPKPGKK